MWPGGQEMQFILMKVFKIEIYKSVNYVPTVECCWTCSCWTLSGRV